MKRKFTFLYNATLCFISFSHKNNLVWDTNTMLWSGWRLETDRYLPGFNLMLTLGPEQTLIFRGKEFTYQQINVYYLNEIYTVYVEDIYKETVFAIIPKMWLSTKISVN